MRIGILGSGGREHAISWALKRSPREPDVFVLPGNGGTEHNVPVDPLDPEAVAGVARDLGLDLLIVGGEEPLARGVVDRLSGSGTVPFGPTTAAARLETSKTWAKAFLDRHGIPTAAWAEARDESDVVSAVRRWSRVVIKADGLAAGKGVVVCEGEQAALAAWTALRKLRPEGEPVFAEQALFGWELSLLCITDGRRAALFPPARDHKAVFDGGQGPNTGGMGAYAPAPQCTPEIESDVVRRIIEPTLKGLRDEGIEYRGFLYFGLMMTGEGPRVLEYNARLGDPEAEVVLPLLAGDLLEPICACAAGRVTPGRLALRDDEVAVDVVLASDGYPGSHSVGRPISGLEGVDEDVLVFHGATRRVRGGWETAGGRVLHVVARGETLAAAADLAYRNAERIRFAGRHMRRDIGRGAP